MASGTLIGLDIGASSIRAVETRKRRNGQIISNFGQAPLPPGTVQGGVIRDDKTVTTALRHLWSASKFRSRQVVLGVSSPQVVVREMTVTNLPRKELRKSLPFQVRDQLPLPVETALLDFQPLEQPRDGNVRGLLIAAPKEAVMIAVRAVERANLHIERVDLGSFALLRAASQLDGQIEAIVDIGAHATSLVIHADGVPLILRTVPRGGAEVTEIVATRLGVSLPEAEALKCQIGLMADFQPRVAAAVQEAVRPLVNEIRSSLTYLSSNDRSAAVNRIGLTGGGALLPGLMEELSHQLGVDVILANPVARLLNSRRGRHDNLDRYQSSAAVSIGLTLGAA